MKASDCRELLGLGAIPLEETVRLLQGLVKQMLRQAESQQPLDIYSAWKAIPEHKLLLSAIDDFSLKLPRISGDVASKDVLRDLTNKLVGLWRGRDLSQARFKLSIRRQIERCFDDHRWTNQLRRRLGTAVQGPCRNRRDFLWELAGPFAWGDPVFQSEIAFWTVQRLRDSCWGVGGNWSPPEFHALTYWALLTCGTTPRFGVGSACVRSLRAFALEQPMTTEGWVGFWEQWLLRKANHYTQHIPALLRVLPWKDVVSDYSVLQEPTACERLLSSGWTNQIPEFMTVQPCNTGAQSSIATAPAVPKRPSS